jgi:hypothetical protein
LFNDTFFSAEIIKEEDIINTLKEVNKDLSKRIGKIKELIDADESITTSFVSELWDEITD